MNFDGLDLYRALAAKPRATLDAAISIAGIRKRRSESIITSRSAGVAWGTSVLPVKCFDDKGESDDDRLIRCYDYITLHRLPWIREADRDFRGGGDKEPVILSIRIEEVKEAQAVYEFTNKRIHRDHAFRVQLA